MLGKLVNTGLKVRHAVRLVKFRGQIKGQVLDLLMDLIF